MVKTDNADPSALKAAMVQMAIQEPLEQWVPEEKQAQRAKTATTEITESTVRPASAAKRVLEVNRVRPVSRRQSTVLGAHSVNGVTAPQLAIQLGSNSENGRVIIQPRAMVARTALESPWKHSRVIGRSSARFTDSGLILTTGLCA